MARSLERACSITTFEPKLGIYDGSIVEVFRTKEGDGSGSGIEEQEDTPLLHSLLFLCCFSFVH